LQHHRRTREATLLAVTARFPEGTAPDRRVATLRTVAPSFRPPP
jgi:hypothetical protein